MPTSGKDLMVKRSSSRRRKENSNLNNIKLNNSDKKGNSDLVSDVSSRVNGTNQDRINSNNYNKNKPTTKTNDHLQNDISPNNENKLVTPRKKKSVDETDLNSVTPPKQRKESIANMLKSPSTPSTLFKKLHLNSPESKLNDEERLGPKNLFGENIYVNARKALNSTVPFYLPGREDELSELKSFILKHLDEKKSGTIYISGPPGTGKTASLSLILNNPEITSKLDKVYVNCTSIKSSTSIYSRITKDLNIKTNGKAEKDYLNAIKTYLTKNHKMVLLVLDEIDQLESKKQSVLYTVFEWPSMPKSQVILIGIANALDLTDRILPRLQTRCELKPRLLHFAPYNKQQIIAIFTERLKEAGVSHVFAPVALQMLAGKVAAISGDVRRALDIGRRVIELVEQNRKQDVLKSLENIEIDIDGVKPLEEKAVELMQVVDVLNNVYGTTNNLNNEESDSLPLQQKIILCTLLLILKNVKNKDITIGKLHDIYKRVCTKQNILGVDQAEFAGLCSLIETRGIIRVSGKKEPRLHKVHLQWDEEDVTAVLKDKKLLSVILQDNFHIGKV